MDGTGFKLERSTEPSIATLAGKIGVARTPLRPAGTAEIDGVPVDVVAESEFIDQGEPIVVVLDQGYRRVVRRAPAQ
jgi:membrane-bound serine protease (ClpP class)